ncbi:NAD(P)-binding domain-containing protein, partial [Streptomyces sp. MCAF7]
MEADTVKRIGIIGVGEIGRAIVTGLCDGAEAADGADGPPEVFLSPRGARTAAELSERYKGVRVCADNQQVVDRSEIVLIAVRGQDRHADNQQVVDRSEIVLIAVRGQDRH